MNALEVKISGDLYSELDDIINQLASSMVLKNIPSKICDSYLDQFKQSIKTNLTTK